MEEINNDPDLDGKQKLFNRFLNGDWKRQFYYRPSKERIAEFALYEWSHDRKFRPGIMESIHTVNLAGRSRI